ncbi:hypothetical protein PPYR_08642 [Photinus pyralis]|uniref:Fucosyltransferase n=2 Tax=Photinus pyralis TaxID=7054 RepID=A0A5N4AK12_PHOPY|nr:hypothetical protein PPYR_08642 [Photinus pyralis]
MYVPNKYNAETAQMKKVSVYNGLSRWAQRAGSETFQVCPVAACTLIDDFADTVSVDAIVFEQPFFNFPINRNLNQVWILYLLESAPNSQSLVSYNNVFNWTATYRKDSDLVAPYAKWVYYDPQVTGKTQKTNYAKNKTKKVAWLVSNCDAINNRYEYAKKLQKHIPLDIYGECGRLRCRDEGECFKMLNDYKFYLSFENSNCRDYITEKLFRNALENNVVPIVLGARKEDYIRSAPKDSFIYAHDFNNPKDLARFLKKLDEDDDMYNSYFRWKGTGEFINTHFWCRLCALLHSTYSNKWYKDVNEWWSGPGVCD